MKRILAWFLALIMVFGMVSLPKMTKAEGEEDPDQPESVEEIADEEEGEEEGEPEALGTRDPSNVEDMPPLTLAVGETTQLITTLTVIDWTYYDSGVVTVDQNGLVTAHGVGADYVFADCIDDETQESYMLQWYVTVIPQLTLSTAALSLPLGGTDTLTAWHDGEDVTADCTWSWTGDTAIASFDETTGTVTASDTHFGTATLSASYVPKGLDHALQASCTVTVVAGPAEEYDAWISGIKGWLGSGYRVRYTIRVRNTIENPTFEVRMGEDGVNRFKDNATDFWCSDRACWMFDGDPKPVEGKDYTEYYILVKFFVRHLNTKALVSVKDGAGNTVKIRSFQSSANGIMGTVGDTAGHTMVDYLNITGIIESDSDYTALADEMIIYCQKALAIDE